MEFKDKVKAVRKRLFITQEQLGNELGCTRQTINRWEDETMLPSKNFARIKALSSKMIRLNFC